MDPSPSPSGSSPVSPGSPTLLLFPTELERERFEDQGGLAVGFALRALCGFGPVAAAARTAQLLAHLRPRRALLIGIAGAYDTERHPVGSALEFGQVALHGVGVGEGERFRGPSALGFPQWPGEREWPERGLGGELDAPRGARAAGSTPPFNERLVLGRARGDEPPGAPEDEGELARGALLLTTCSASDSPAQARERRARYPHAAAEDMEGFGVASACALCRTPLTIVRGISNRVGDRSPELWRIPAALAAARRLALEVLAAREALP